MNHSNHCALAGCSKLTYHNYSTGKDYPTCGQTHGRVYDAINNTKGKIEFYDQGKHYYELTNFFENYRHGTLKLVPYNKHNFRTSEHAFQYTKFSYGNPAAQQVANQILKAKTPRDAFEIAQKNQHLIRGDWMQIRDNVMYEIVKSKFTESSRYLRDVLVGTGNTYLVEASSDDDYWGYGFNKMGENKLGKILMRVREEIKLGIK